MRLALGLVIVLLAALVLAAAAPAQPDRPFDVVASAPSASIAVASDRAVVGRGDSLNITVWLNVTGNGQFQRTLVNVTFDTEPDPSLNSLRQTPPWTQPAACGTQQSSNWFLEWECVGLRAGTYVWGIPATVPGDASVGHAQRVVASTVSTVGTGNVSAQNSTSVWIAGAVLRIADVDSLPADSIRPGQVVQFWINVTNVVGPDENVSGNTTGTAFNVSMVILLDPGLQLGQGAGNLTPGFPSLLLGAVLSVNLEAIVAQNVTPGTNLGIRVRLNYQDFNGHPIGPIEAASGPLYVVPANVLSTPNLVAGAAIGLAAILTTLMVLLYAGQRKIVIDEAFLMTKGGLLIRHVSREPGVKKDDDIVASMFVAIQEFVRDSFQREASLDSVAFGKRHAAVVRGELTILAAVISHGDPEAVTPELLATVRAIEARHWDVLRAWDGNLSRLAGVDAMLARLMKGEFRAPWRVQLA